MLLFFLPVVLQKLNKPQTESTPQLIGTFLSQDSTEVTQKGQADTGGHGG